MNRGLPAGVASPCISVCRMDEATGLCGGCLRTLDEIAGWSVMDDAAKREVWRLIGRRRLAARQRRQADGDGHGSAGSATDDRV